MDDIEQYRRKKSNSGDDLNQYARVPMIDSGEKNNESPQEKKGFGGVWSDVKDVANNIPSALISAAIGAPSAISQFGEQALSLPYENLKFIKNSLQHGYKPEYVPKLTANMFKGLVGLINKPSEAVDYAGKKGFIPENLGHYIRGDMPDVGLKPEEENPIAQSLPAFGGAYARLYEAVHPTMHLKRSRRLANERGALAHIPEHELNAVTDYIHPDLPLRELLDQARTGNYDAVFGVQSDLGQYARQARFSPFARERLHGRQANALRERILDHMRGSLTEQGHGDIAALKQRGQNQFRRYKQIQPYAKMLLALGLGANPLKQLYKKITSD